MARTGYGAEFKAKIVIEVLQGARSLEEIASENDLNPNMVRNWKKEFLENASMVSDEKNINREAKRQAERQEKERERMLSTIGQLTLECDFLQDCFRKAGQLIPLSKAGKDISN